ncbi:hypothetical protein R1sor_026275 [Riccia sorocarpa]|uniref:Uncharacterized protein n=1 Tax=Riccia sorocarpa TaxID=122646 RepID=A0ABD3GDR9_9MARC
MMRYASTFTATEWDLLIHRDDQIDAHMDFLARGSTSVNLDEDTFLLRQNIDACTKGTGAQGGDFGKEGLKDINKLIEKGIYSYYYYGEPVIAAFCSKGGVGAAA